MKFMPGGGGYRERAIAPDNGDGGFWGPQVGDTQMAPLGGPAAPGGGKDAMMALLMAILGKGRGDQGSGGGRVESKRPMFPMQEAVDFGDRSPLAGMAPRNGSTPGSGQALRMIGGNQLPPDVPGRPSYGAQGGRRPMMSLAKLFGGL